MCEARSLLRLSERGEAGWHGSFIAGADRPAVRRQQVVPLHAHNGLFLCEITELTGLRYPFPPSTLAKSGDIDRAKGRDFTLSVPSGVARGVGLNGPGECPLRGGIYLCFIRVGIR